MTSLAPVILFFLLCLIAGLARSELRLPAAIYDFLSIGLKGGVELAKQPLLPLLPQFFTVVAMGAILPLLAYPVLLRVGGLKRADAASIAAHYGSVSVGTYAVAYLAYQQVAYEEYIPVFVVLLEMPTIVVGILLARGISRETRWTAMAHDVMLGKGMVLLAGGLAIGWIAGPVAIEPAGELFFGLFKGFLALFLLEMGLITASQIGGLRRHGLFLTIFGVLAPLCLSLIGAALGWSLGLSPGGTALLATLFASASYIAVPAAMHMAVPEANPSLSLSVALGGGHEIMGMDNRKLVTILAEAALEAHIVRDIERLGAHGYTITEARGKGSCGVRDASCDELRNIRVKVVCDEPVVTSIAEHLRQHYYENYAMIFFVGDVAVLRPEKF